jgi:hypothetical protein
LFEAHADRKYVSHGKALTGGKQVLWLWVWPLCAKAYFPFCRNNSFEKSLIPNGISNTGLTDIGVLKMTVRAFGANT